MNEKEQILSKLPKIGEEQIALLEKLSNACAISGDENEVRAIVLDEIKPLVDDLKIDAMGNVLAVKKARVNNPLRVMLAAHMDEVGFMIVDKEEGGLFRFETVGGIDVRQLAGKSVWVGRDHHAGIIGARPIHLTTAEERENKIPLEALRIDLGTGGGELAKLGDRAAFATTFQQIGPSLRGKALDNRFGVTTLIELIKHAPENIELLAAFTVQEEVGLRGAKVAAYSFHPDLAIALDSTPANDLPKWDGSENTQYNTRLGFGPSLYVSDGATISDPRLVKHFMETAENLAIPYQIRQPGGGGTDAGAMHKQLAGIPSLSISVPGRYAHTAVMLARTQDWQNTISAVHAMLQTITAELLKTERQINH